MKDKPDNIRRITGLLALILGLWSWVYLCVSPTAVDSDGSVSILDFMIMIFLILSLAVKITMIFDKKIMLINLAGLTLWLSMIIIACILGYLGPTIPIILSPYDKMAGIILFFIWPITDFMDYYTCDIDNKKIN